jgi:hypothetical protein
MSDHTILNVAIAFFLGSDVTINRVISEVVLRAWAINFLEGFVFEPNEGGKVGLRFFEDVTRVGRLPTLRE